MMTVHETVELRTDNDDEGDHHGWGIQALVLGDSDGDRHVYLELGSHGGNYTVSSIRPDRARALAALLVRAADACEAQS